MKYLILGASFTLFVFALICSNVTFAVSALWLLLIIVLLKI